MELFEIVVHTPEYCVGDVVGELNRIGGLLEEMTSESAKAVIWVRAKIPVKELIKFEVWLSKVTKGQGQIRNPNSGQC